MKRLSHTMKVAIEEARENGGRLTKIPKFALWAAPGYVHPNFGKRTIHALVERGLAEYTGWPGEYGADRVSSPIEVTLTAKAAEVS